MLLPPDGVLVQNGRGNHHALMNRASSLQRLRSQREPFDFVIVGGGATGLGTAVDADNLVTNPKLVFAARDKIYASVLSTGKHQGLTIKARWTAPDGKLVAETEQALVPEKATVSTFSIGNTQAWPTGAYTLDISLNGLVQRTVSFEIK